MAFSALGHTSDLTWEKTLAVAQEKNPDLRSARYSVEAARSAYRAASADWLPQITGSANHTRSDAAGGGPGPSTDRSYALSAQQSLFSGFSSKASRDSARSLWMGESANLRKTEAQLRSDLRTAFSEALYAQENVKVLATIKERRKDNKEMIQLRYNAGRENRGSLMRAQALLSRASFEYERGERERQTSRKRLARTLGVSDSEFQAVSGTFTVILDRSLPDFPALVAQTPEYDASRFALERARAQRTLARADFFPGLSLTARGQRRDSLSEADNDSWSVGGSLSYAFFTGGRDFQDIKQAQANLEKSSADLESVSREKAVFLEETYAALQDAVGLARVQDEFLQASEERARIARAQYGNGLASFQDWDLIENDLINAQKDALSARRSAVAALAAWERAVGLGMGAP